MGQALKLDFKPHFYGPYAIGVEKVLYHLNGVYLKGMEQGQIKPFESLKLNYEYWDSVNEYVQNMAAEDRDRLNNMLIFLKNFTSELSLEILASVDLILVEHPDFTIDQVMNSIAGWSNRKKELFRRESVERAYNHLHNYKTQLNLA